MTIKEMKDIIKDVKVKSGVGGKRFSSDNLEKLANYCANADDIPNDNYFEVMRSFLRFAMIVGSLSTDEYMKNIGKDLASKI